MGKLAEKVAVITGAGSGIGRATALLFAGEGARVVVADLAPHAGHETVKMIKEAGGESVFVEVNVSRSADIQRMIGLTVEAYGRLDILFNNAGMQGKYIMTADMTEETWDMIIATNLKGVFLGSKYAIPVMLNQGGGVIINTASSAGIIGLPGLQAYCASKAGVIHLTRTIALEYADKNIRINCICPGGIITPMSGIGTTPTDPASIPPFKMPQAMRRFGLPEEVAKAVLYLASDDSSFVTGTSIVIDGGWTAGIPKIPQKTQN